jgi:transcription antitermination factor NusG
MSWWAVYSEPGRAVIARDSLLARGLGAFCPVERLTRRRKLPNRNKYRTETVTAPVFGRYLFAEGEAAAVLAVRGVADLVRCGYDALEVPLRVVLGLRGLTHQVDGVGDLMGSRDVARLSLGFWGSVGDSFRFSTGPLAGFLGVLSSVDGLDKDGTVRAYVDMLGGRCEVTVKHSQVGPIVKSAVAEAAPVLEMLAA